jgi:ribosomal protein S18 acetylase RimI-like enzyme
MFSNSDLTEIAIRNPENEHEVAQYYSVRWKTLREPWGEPEGSEKDDIEEDCFHLAAFLKEKVVGVARIQKNSFDEAQIRYMGVLPEYRRHGIGRLLIEDLEKAAQRKGLTRIVLDARENAVGFYIVLGYEVTGESYVLFDSIQHYRMQKLLET